MNPPPPQPLPFLSVFYSHNGRGRACPAHKNKIVYTTRTRVYTRIRLFTRRLHGPKLRHLHFVTKIDTACFIFTFTTSSLCVRTEWYPCSVTTYSVTTYGVTTYGVTTYGVTSYAYRVTTSSSRFTKRAHYSERALPHSHPIPVSYDGRKCCLCARHPIAGIAPCRSCRRCQ